MNRCPTFAIGKRGVSVSPTSTGGGRCGAPGSPFHPDEAKAATHSFATTVRQATSILGMAEVNAVTPIQQPISGDAYSGETLDPIQALAQFYRALNTRDFELMQQNWSASEEAAMDNPLGGIKRGWNEIRAVYQRLFQSPGQYHFEFYDYTLHAHKDTFYAVGRERGTLTIHGRTLSLAIRTTRIFRREDATWRQVHHHGSIEDPEMLAEYQAAVGLRPAATVEGASGASLRSA